MNDRKIAVAVRGDLAVWQKLNVTAFLTSGVGAAHPSLIGAPYVDADGGQYPPMLATPVRVFTGDVDALRRAVGRALSRDLIVSAYVDGMFATMNDDDNRRVFAATPLGDAAIAGLVVAGDRRQVDKAFDKLRPHD